MESTLKLRIAIAIVFAANCIAVSAADHNQLVGTMQNGSPNHVIFYNAATGVLVATVNTGAGGNASGNAGGLETCGRFVIAVDHDGKKVSVIGRADDGIRLLETIGTQSGPESVSCGNDHLVVLEDSLIESFPMSNSPFPRIMAAHDGIVPASGSTGAQILAIGERAYYTEKAGQLFRVDMGAGGVAGPSVQIALPDDANNTPFALAVIPDSPDPKLVVAAAHSARLLLFDATTDALLSDAPSNKPFAMSAPCWLAVYGTGPFQIFAGDSPQSAVTSWTTTDKTVAFGNVAAQLNGAATDIAIQNNTLAVIQPGSGNLSVFQISPAGGLELMWSKIVPGSSINGVVVW